MLLSRIDLVELGRREQCHEKLPIRPHGNVLSPCRIRKLGKLPDGRSLGGAERLGEAKNKKYRPHHNEFGKRGRGGGGRAGGGGGGGRGGAGGGRARGGERRGVY